MRLLLCVFLLCAGSILLLLSMISGVARRQSPRPPWIVYTSNESGNYEVYRMRPDGSYLRNMTHHPAGDSLPLWSPATQEIIFVSNRDKNYEVYKVLPTGWRVQNISQEKADDTFPQWSPDGTWVIFETHHTTGREIYRVRSDGTDKRNLTNHPSHDWFPRWSGEWIIFMSNREGDSFNYRMLADGSQVEKLPDQPADISYSGQQSPIVDLPWNPRYAFFGGIFCLLVACGGCWRMAIPAHAICYPP